MKNTMESLVGITDLRFVIHEFEGNKTKEIAKLLLLTDHELDDFMDNFLGKGFSPFDDLLTYRSYRITTENASYEDFNTLFICSGVCEAVRKHFYQAFEEIEITMINDLFIESKLTSLNVFDRIRANHDLSLYKMVL